MYKKRKKIIIKDIPLSLPFVIRDVCKHCGSPPIKYYRLSSKSCYKNHNDFKEDAVFLATYFAINEPIPSKSTAISVVNDLRNYKHSITDKSYSPRYHKIISKSVQKDEYEPLEFLICKCEKTEWGFTRISVKTRVEVSSKRSNKVFPLKFEY